MAVASAAAARGHLVSVTDALDQLHTLIKRTYVASKRYTNMAIDRATLEKEEVEQRQEEAEAEKHIHEDTAKFLWNLLCFLPSLIVDVLWDLPRQIKKHLVAILLCVFIYAVWMAVYWISAYLVAPITDDILGCGGCKTDEDLVRHPWFPGQATSVTWWLNFTIMNVVRFVFELVDDIMCGLHHVFHFIKCPSHSNIPSYIDTDTWPGFVLFVHMRDYCDRYAEHPTYWLLQTCTWLPFETPWCEDQNYATFCLIFTGGNAFIYILAIIAIFLLWDASWRARRRIMNMIRAWRRHTHDERMKHEMEQEMNIIRMGEVAVDIAELDTDEDFDLATKSTFETLDSLVGKDEEITWRLSDSVVTSRMGG